MESFSIFLGPAGRFNLAPLYDVMSAQPAVDAGQLRKNQFKLALAAGDNRHTVIDTIVPRHFMQTAVRNGMPAAVVQAICAELAETAERAIDDTLAALPDGFPAGLADSVAGGMRGRVRLLGRVSG